LAGSTTKRLTDAQREALIADIIAGELSTHAICKKHDLSSGTVAKYVKRYAPDRSVSRRGQTAAALDQKRLDDERRHAELVEALRTDADFYRRVAKTVLTRSLTSQEANGTGPAADWQFVGTRNLAIIVGIMTDKYRSLREMQTPHGVEGGRALMEEIAESLREFA
jgi:transposase-like protein